MKDVEVRYTFSEAEFVDSLAFSLRRMRNAMLFVVLLYIPMAVAAVLIAPHSAARHWKIGAVCIVLFAAGAWGLVRWSLKRQYASRPDRGCEVRYRFRSDGVRSEIVGLATATRAWALVVKVVETPRGFLLFQNEQVYEWVPMHGFDGPDDVETFRQLLSDLEIEIG